MPFQPVQSDHEYHSSLKRRQSFLWIALLVVVLFIAGVVFLGAYQFIGSDSSSGGGPSTVVAPAVKAVSSVARGEATPRGEYFLIGEVSSTDKRLKIFKVYYAPFSKEEVFSIPWRKSEATPTIVEYGENFAVFLDSGQSILITRDGGSVPLANSFFVPQDPRFTISPDGKKMLYFKQFSSLGTRILTIRDLEKNEDVFAWPISSPASEACDFNGWSVDGAKAYCTSIKNGKALVRAIDVQRYSYATVASFSGVRAGQFYPLHELFVAADATSIFTFNITTKERTDILALPGEKVSSVLLTADKSKVVFASDGDVYAVQLDGSNRKSIEHATRIVSLVPDTHSVLVEVSEEGESHYAIIDIDKESHRELNGITKDITHTQLIGWFSK
ncbi:MAG: hypothetical protein NUV61_00475 [Candidatus Azambacteria bacterium]|nr:hypothetical protein [Candidatus Azambacteria bacterium]